MLKKINSNEMSDVISDLYLGMFIQLLENIVIVGQNELLLYKNKCKSQAFELRIVYPWKIQGSSFIELLIFLFLVLPSRKDQWNALGLTPFPNNIITTLQVAKRHYHKKEHRKLATMITIVNNNM